MTQKERDAPIAHSKRRRRKGASVPFAGCITLSVCIAISNGCRRNHYTARLSHIISVLLIPLEFPTLLAIREIIANANFYHNVNSESARVRNPSAKVQRISEIHSTFAEKVKKQRACPPAFLNIVIISWPSRRALDCYRFVCERYGKENIIGFEVHLDETEPHIHVNIVPVAIMKQRGRVGGYNQLFHLLWRQTGRAQPDDVRPP